MTRKTFLISEERAQLLKSAWCCADKAVENSVNKV